MLGQPTYGTYSLGPLTYRTAEEARAVADELGLASVHKHKMDGMLVWMPATSCEQLREAVERRGLTMPKQCSDDGGLGMGGGMLNMGGGI